MSLKTPLYSKLHSAIHSSLTRRSPFDEEPAASDEKLLINATDILLINATDELEIN